MFVLNRLSGPVSSVLHKLCSILALLKDLLNVAKLVDSSVLQLMKTMLDTFSVDNIQLLQLKAIGVVCMVGPRTSLSLSFSSFVSVLHCSGRDSLFLSHFICY